MEKQDKVVTVVVVVEKEEEEQSPLPHLLRSPHPALLADLLHRL